ncbi:Uncharacterised protein [Mycobacteroides abscessus subsp. abscessus]|nr:Uncharacterised protein [Mycobacteroides abscessus subsp. abscessus]
MCSDSARATDPRMRAIIRPAEVDKSSSPPCTVAIFTPRASAMSISRSRSFMERYSRSVCQHNNASNSPAAIAVSIASKPGRFLPVYADRSLSSNWATTSQPSRTANAKHSSSWRATPSPSPV